jgi:hypothetical protein
MTLDMQRAIEIGVRSLHVVMVMAWLLFDFIVYWLHFKVKDPGAPLLERLERARIMHAIDRVVAYLFIGTLPVGLALCWLTDTPLFGAAWLSWKHLMYGMIVVSAVVLIPVSGTALRNLNAMAAGATNTAVLNAQIRRDMNFGMPFVFLIWILIVAMSVLSVFNSKWPNLPAYLFPAGPAS